MAYVSSIERIGIEKGVLQGIEKGIEQGVVQGESKLLRRLLKQRFGTLPAWVLDKISHATEYDLERWSDEVLSAPSLEAIFDDSAIH